MARELGEEFKVCADVNGFGRTDAEEIGSEGFERTGADEKGGDGRASGDGGGVYKAASKGVRTRAEAYMDVAAEAEPKRGTGAAWAKMWKVGKELVREAGSVAGAAEGAAEALWEAREARGSWSSTASCTRSCSSTSGT